MADPIKVLRNSVAAIVATVLATSVAYSASEQQNLLSIQDLKLDRTNSTVIAFDKEPLIRDGEEATAAQIRIDGGNAVELVFEFNGETVSPSSLRLKASQFSDKQAQIEVLVSTISATSGYTSLRVEPIKKTDKWQQFSFEQSAAKWLMVKIAPFDKSASLTISELEIQGHVGAPVTTYAFNESPADALAVLSQLQSSIDVGITKDEKSLFADARDGQLDEWSFAEASLLSSGVHDADERKLILAEIDALESQVRQFVPTNGSSFEKGQALLDWLHTNAFQQGYKESQTDVSKVLSTGTFNCVSSATLYNILARRMGLDARGIEVPDHAFSILYDGTRHVDIETTTPIGFNPARNKAAINDFANTTGFVYINDKNRAKRREGGETGMVALTYYNHGVELSQNKQHHQALINYFRALSLDPGNKSAVKNALAELTNWSANLLKKGDAVEAIRILETGLALAPNDRTIRHNTRVAWQKKVEQDVDKGDVELAFASLKEVFEKTNDSDFLRMQSLIFQQQGENQIEKGNWSEALTLASIGLERVEEAAQKDLRRWRSGIILRWSNAALDAKDFATAVSVLERGLGFSDANYKIKNNLAYSAQEWIAHTNKTQGLDAGREVALALAKRFPDLSALQGVVSGNLEKEAREAADAGRFEEAITLYTGARKQRPNDRNLVNNEQVTWDQWARTFMKAKDWKRALEVYERALATPPKAQLFTQNIAFVAQEWSVDIAQQGDPLEAEAILATLTERFPSIQNIGRMRGRIVSQEITKLVDAQKFEEAADLLSSFQPYFANKAKFDDLSTYIYFQWVDGFVKTQEWQRAIDIQTSGFELHPDNASMKRNLVATWNLWANAYMDKQDWQGAINVYERGLVALPGTGLFKNNLAYSRSKLNGG